ncbi:serine/threonine-protein kinase [Neobacillus muris]|uniref:serine/threonine-protein kinase n=1 Tax=Neobacillus muris TaxID=2941334 RepID=UPI002041E80D|nr:serine/threonine-protein kinase [Neobacillus muris]
MILTNTTLQFLITEEIGLEGRNSKVYLALDPQLNSTVVIKRIVKGQMNYDEFFKEAHILYNYPHPHITEINYGTQDNDYVYISMPFYQKGSINSLMNQRFLTVREIIKYSIDFLMGLHYIHTKNLIHFDVKPTNILISDSDRAMLTDFGLAKFVDEDSMAAADMFYTPIEPPEHFITDDLTAHADIYQAGVTMYRMCNGNNYFHMKYHELVSQGLKNQAIISGNFPNRNFYLPHIPVQLRRVINDMMKVDPDDRPNTALEAINSLAKIDKCLDWQYTLDTNTGTEVWTLDKENSILSISLSRIDWSIIGRKYTKSSRRTNNVSALTDNSSNSEREAYTKIATMIRNHN